MAACEEPGASISGVALAHGLNTNLVRKWRSGRGVKMAGVARLGAAAPSQVPVPGGTPEFVAIQMPAPTTPDAQALIHIELRRGPLALNVRWPSAAAGDCRVWLSELVVGVLK